MATASSFGSGKRGPAVNSEEVDKGENPNPRVIADCLRAHAGEDDQASSTASKDAADRNAVR